MKVFIIRPPVSPGLPCSTLFFTLLHSVLTGLLLVSCKYHVFCCFPHIPPSTWNSFLFPVKVSACISLPQHPGLGCISWCSLQNTCLSWHTSFCRGIKSLSSPPENKLHNSRRCVLFIVFSPVLSILPSIGYVLNIWFVWAIPSTWNVFSSLINLRLFSQEASHTQPH